MYDCVFMCVHIIVFYVRVQDCFLCGCVFLELLTCVHVCMCIHVCVCVTVYVCVFVRVCACSCTSKCETCQPKCIEVKV